MSRRTKLVLALLLLGPTLASLVAALAILPAWVTGFWVLWVAGMALAWKLRPRTPAAGPGVAALDPTAPAFDRF